MTVTDRFFRIVSVALVVVIVLGATGWRALTGAIEESYSAGQYSASTENAQYRGVFVKSPVVHPSSIALNDSVADVVTDAWIERPTHVRYRWFLLRREFKDSTFRAVIHLARVARDSAIWNYGRRRAFAESDILIDGQEPARSGDAAVRTIYLESDRPFRDTISLTLRR
jgi:hypothetical protein